MAPRVRVPSRSDFEQVAGLVAVVGDDGERRLGCGVGGAWCEGVGEDGGAGGFVGGDLGGVAGADPLG